MKYLVTTPSQLSHALKSERKARGLTQEDVGRRVGLLLKTISALENRPESSSIDSLLKLLSALGMELTIAPKGGETLGAHSDTSNSERW
jgi:HTH-type transcriptional regulator / antitoxin HipB